MRAPLVPTLVVAAAAVAAVLIGSPRSSKAQAPSTPIASGSCLDGGYLLARVRGALTLDLSWRGAEMECDGGLRPDGRGVRVAIAGPERTTGRRLRFVFGISNTREGESGRGLPANVTLIFEGEQRLFATRGDDKCTVDELRQERIGALGGPSRTWRIVARGFCTSPAASTTREERILVSRFDFSGRVTFDEDVS